MVLENLIIPQAYTWIVKLSKMIPLISIIFQMKYVVVTTLIFPDFKS
jgi:hypothetical protein